MATIPLPALAVRPQETSPLDTYARVLQLKNLMAGQQLIPGQVQQQQQEIQQKQIQLNDTQAMSQAMREWDGKDLNELPSLILKHGGSANAVFGAKNQIVSYTKNAADAQEAVLKNQATTNDLIAGHLETVKSAPPEQKQQAFEAALGDLEQKGLLKPGQVNHQYPGDDQLAVLEKTFMGQKAIVDQELEKRKTAATESEAATRATAAQTSAARLQAELPGGPLNRVTQDIAVATNPEIQAGKEKVAAAEGAARANIEAQAARGSNAALANVPAHLVAPATQEATKAGSDYAQAQSVTQRLQAMMDAAKAGNVVAYQLIPQEGALQLTTSQGVHRINMAEIQNYGGGSLWQRMEGHIGKQLTGKSIPDSVLNDMADMQKVQAEGARTKYENTLKTINQNYGSTFKPVEMETKSQSNAPAPKATPSGATHIGVGSVDKKKHYLDSNGKDLGLAE